MIIHWLHVQLVYNITLVQENSNPRVSTSIYADDLDLKQLDTRDQLLQTQESKGIVPEDGCLSNMELIQLARQIVLGMVCFTL